MSSRTTLRGLRASHRRNQARRDLRSKSTHAHNQMTDRVFQKDTFRVEHKMSDLVSLNWPGVERTFRALARNWPCSLPQGTCSTEGAQ